MQLRYISVALLIAEAGGDPWAINKSLQAGRPAQISDLAEAFHAAGRCTSEASAAFDEARRRFEAAWNRENGDHPINDSAEVQRVVQSLGAQWQQLPKIGVDLENIAAALAEAQRSASGQIATLESHLQRLDDLIGQALDEEDDPDVTADEMSQLEAFIAACEEDAIKDTQATLVQIQMTRDGYTGCLQKSLQNLRAEGYDPAAIRGVDSDPAPPPSALQSGELSDLRQVTNQAVVDQMGKVRAAQDAVNKALATLYTKGPGSPEGEAAARSLPKLKADLARTIDDLGKIPDYNTIDPASVSATPDGRFMFTYNVDGQPVQVVGQLKNGAGEFFDQATGTSYTFKDGKLTGMRTLDPGKVEATPEPLWSAITLAVGGPELKAGGEAAWQGLKTLFSREALTGLTSDNVLPRAVSAAEARAAIAQADLPPRTLPGAGGEPLPGAHPGPPPEVEPAPLGGQGGGVVEHAPSEHVPAAPGEHVPATDFPHSPPPAFGEPPPPLPSDHPLFHGYQPIEPGPEFTRPDGSLIYPDDSLPTKPYAVPGTVMPDAHLPADTVLSRFGYPGGSYLAPEGTPFAQLSLPPDSALKPYFQYVVENPGALPRGYHIEESRVAPWFQQPGGGTQYRIIGPDGKNAPVDALLESGYLREVRH